MKKLATILFVYSLIISTIHAVTPQDNWQNNKYNAYTYRVALGGAVPSLDAIQFNNIEEGGVVNDTDTGCTYVIMARNPIQYMKLETNGNVNVLSLSLDGNTISTNTAGEIAALESRTNDWNTASVDASFSTNWIATAGAGVGYSNWIDSVHSDGFVFGPSDQLAGLFMNLSSNFISVSIAGALQMPAEAHNFNNSRLDGMGSASHRSNTAFGNYDGGVAITNVLVSNMKIGRSSGNNLIFRNSGLSGTNMGLHAEFNNVDWIETELGVNSFFDGFEGLVQFNDITVYDPDTHVWGVYTSNVGSSLSGMQVDADSVAKWDYANVNFAGDVSVLGAYYGDGSNLTGTVPLTNNVTLEMTNIVSFPAGITVAGTLIDGTTGTLSVADVTFDASWIPDAPNAYDIGSAAFPIRELFAGSNSIWIGSLKLSDDGSGTLQVADGTNAPVDYASQDWVTNYVGGAGVPTLEAVLASGNLANGAISNLTGLASAGALNMSSPSGQSTWDIFRLNILASDEIFLQSGGGERIILDSVSHILLNADYDLRLTVANDLKINGTAGDNGYGFTKGIMTDTNALRGMVTNQIALNPEGFGDAVLADYNVFTESNKFNSIEIAAGEDITWGNGNGRLYLPDYVNPKPYWAGGAGVVRLHDQGDDTFIFLSDTARTLYGPSGNSALLLDETKSILQDNAAGGIWQSEGEATNDLQIVNYQTMTNYVSASKSYGEIYVTNGNQIASLQSNVGIETNASWVEFNQASPASADVTTDGTNTLKVATAGDYEVCLDGSFGADASVDVHAHIYTSTNNGANWSRVAYLGTRRDIANANDFGDIGKNGYITLASNTWLRVGMYAGDATGGEAITFHDFNLHCDRLD